jgi:muramoyltetrapeptide carboxypeptidase
MIIARKLQKGDIIAIVSPAGKVNPLLIMDAAKKLEHKGYRVKIYPNVKGSFFQYAATDIERLTDLQEAMDSPDVSCILCARGGYGVVRIVDKLNFDGILKHPKWLVGFSDITVLHSALQNIGLASIHGPMVKTFSDATQDSVKSFFQVLEGNAMNYNFNNHVLNRLGVVSGMLVGGNLSILSSLLGTPYMPEIKGKILFIEDLNEYLYKLDRMMISLKLAGVLNQISGLIVGGFTEMLDNTNPFGKSACEIIAEHVSEYSYPVAFNFPAGHIADNRAFALGVETQLDVSNDSVEVKQKIIQ